MRQNIFNPGGTGARTVDYPNEIFFSRGKFAYFKITSTQDAGDMVKFTLKWGLKSTTIHRQLDSEGVAIFRVSSILDSWGAAYEKSELTGLSFEYTINSLYKWLDLGTAIIGLSDMEITRLSEQQTPNNRPAAQKIVIYPSFGEIQHIFVPEIPTEKVELDTTTGFVFYTGKGAPFIPFNPSDSVWDSVYDDSIGISAGERRAMCRIDLDYCTEGLFVKWKDKHGIPYMYRWSVESEANEVSSDAIYGKIDDILNSYEVNSKTLTRRFTLHSRLIDNDLFEMCKSIISGHDIQYYDTDTSAWRRALIEEGEAVDNGAVLKNLVIEMTEKTYNL